MIEIDPLSIVQINVTIITGLLILLTITNLVKKIKGFWMPKSVVGTMVPFAISSILALLQFVTEQISGINFVSMSVGSMIIGFVVLIGMMIKISSPEIWKKK